MEAQAEPTLALFCPIDGGDYVVDDIVKGLMRRVGADVVVLVSVQLAAARVRLLSLVCAFTDYMRSVQPKIHFNCSNNLFAFSFISHLYLLLRRLLDWPWRMKTV